VIESGKISGPLSFCIEPPEHAKSQSMEACVQELLKSSARTKGKSVLETMEHLALLKRWYYRGSRTGEIFIADDKGELPMRRIVRGISRVFRGEKPEDANQTGPSSIPG
jgi:hypothetical protein